MHYMLNKLFALIKRELMDVVTHDSKENVVRFLFFCCHAITISWNIRQCYNTRSTFGVKTLSEL